MTGRNLTRRLEQLEARVALVDRQIDIVIRFVGPEGGVTDSLVLEVSMDRRLSLETSTCRRTLTANIRASDYRDSGGKSLAQAHRIRTVANSDPQRGTPRCRFHRDCHTGLQSESCHLTQSGGVPVRHAANHGGDASRPFCQRHLCASGQRAASLGNRLPVRIRFRVPQFRGDPIFEPLRDEVLEAFRLFVNLVPRIVEEIMEEPLDQAVMAKNLQSAHPPGCRNAPRGAFRISQTAAFAPRAFGAFP